MNEIEYFVVKVHRRTGKAQIVSDLWKFSDDGKNKAQEFYETLPYSSRYEYRVCATIYG